MQSNNARYAVRYVKDAYEFAWFASFKDAQEFHSRTDLELGADLGYTEVVGSTGEVLS